MNYKALKDNLIYVLLESQIKIGYTDNACSVNYPLYSLNNLLEEELDDDAMMIVLHDFARYAEDPLGRIALSRYDGQFCLTVPKDGVRYVHENVSDSGFLTELVALLREQRTIGLDDVLSVFRRYGDDVVCERAEDEEYNYVICFGDNVPDSFVYLFELELGHASYHRMTKKDFATMNNEK